MKDMLKDRFEGTDGKRRLFETVLNAALVKHDNALADGLVEVGELVEVAAGESLITKGSFDNDMYVIIAGEFDVTVNGRHVATRGPGDAVGEMTIVEPSKPRAATVTAIEDALVLKITEPDFTKIADENPQLWKSIAAIGLARLREREIFHDSPNDNPVLFVGCSTESLSITEEIQLQLKHANIDVQIWTNGVFLASGTTIDDLQAAANRADFAAFLFAPDDVVVSRDVEFYAPRDNTIFELGFFMGNLDRSRTFIIKEHSSEIKIPTDLLNITPITYVNGRDVSIALAPVCTEIKKIVKTIGPK